MWSRQGRVLVVAAAAKVHSDPVAEGEHLHGASGEAHLHLCAGWTVTPVRSPDSHAADQWGVPNQMGWMAPTPGVDAPRSVWMSPRTFSRSTPSTTAVASLSVAC